MKEILVDLGFLVRINSKNNQVINSPMDVNGVVDVKTFVVNQEIHVGDKVAIKPIRIET